MLAFRALANEEVCPKKFSLQCALLSSGECCPKRCGEAGGLASSPECNAGDADAERLLNCFKIDKQKKQCERELLQGMASMATDGVTKPAKSGRVKLTTTAGLRAEKVEE